MDSAVFSDRVTLPEHLREVLEVLLLKPCVVFLPHELRDDLRAALDEAEKTAAAQVEAENVEKEAQDGEEGDQKGEVVKDEIEPPTIAYDLLKRVSQWARKNDSMGCIKRASCGTFQSVWYVKLITDPSQYTIIALLAGTQVYYPPKQRERLQTATSNTVRSHSAHRAALTNTVNSLPTFLSESTSSNNSARVPFFSQRSLNRTERPVFNPWLRIRCISGCKRRSRVCGGRGCATRDSDGCHRLCRRDGSSVHRWPEEG